MQHRADKFTGQARTVLAYLNQGRPLTQKQADQMWGVARLASVVRKLREHGVPIVTELVAVPARSGRKGRANVARYRRVRTRKPS